MNKDIIQLINNFKIETLYLSYDKGIPLVIKESYVNNKLHSIDDAAVEYSNGTKEYYLHDKKYSYEEWLKIRKLLPFI